MTNTDFPKAVQRKEPMTSRAIQTLTDNTEEVMEREENGLLILSPMHRPASRRVLFVNVSGGVSTWRKVKNGLVPTNRLWGCAELLRMGYEVAIAEALPDFYLYRNP